MRAYKESYKRFRHIVSTPIIYIVIIPLLILDIGMELYHRTCFPLYDIPFVKRSSYIRIDRQKLSYLNWLQKLNCMYCGYANGLLHYATVIAGETEKYWCGIEHKKDVNFISPKHQKVFLGYGDKDQFDEYMKYEKK